MKALQLGWRTDGIIKYIFGITSWIAFAIPAYAQDQTMELLESVGPFQINRVAQSKVCFATYNGPVCQWHRIFLRNI